MLVLGIETSCDDTAAAVLLDGRTILANVVSSQDEIHGAYGGVVPELASRQHIRNILPIIDAALGKAGVNLKDLGGIAVTRGPGRPMTHRDRDLRHPQAGLVSDDDGLDGVAQVFRRVLPRECLDRLLVEGAKP